MFKMRRDEQVGTCIVKEWTHVYLITDEVKIMLGRQLEERDSRLSAEDLSLRVGRVAVDDNSRSDALLLRVVDRFLPMLDISRRLPIFLIIILTGSFASGALSGLWHRQRHANEFDFRLEREIKDEAIVKRRAEQCTFAFAAQAPRKTVQHTTCTAADVDMLALDGDERLAFVPVVVLRVAVCVGVEQMTKRIDELCRSRKALVVREFCPSELEADVVKVLYQLFSQETVLCDAEIDESFRVVAVVVGVCKDFEDGGEFWGEEVGEVGTSFGKVAFILCLGSGRHLCY